MARGPVKDGAMDPCGEPALPPETHELVPLPGTVGRRWLGERLWLGEESAVSKAIRRVKASRDPVLNGLKQRLLKGRNADQQQKS